MRAYGLPRHAFWKYPDSGDCHEYGLKTSAGRLYGSRRAQKSYIRSTKNRNVTRREWKKRYRAIQKRELQIEIDYIED